jgi:hypothetical protein
VPPRGPDPLARVDEERAARAAALRLPQVAAPFRLTVAPHDARATTRVLRSLGATWVRTRVPGGVLFLIANPRELSAEEHPFVARLPEALAARGVVVRSLSLP